LFIEGDPATIEVAMRAPRETVGPMPVEVEISAEGNRGQHWLVGDSWTKVRVPLPPSKTPDLHLRRINIKADRVSTWRDRQTGATRQVGVEVADPVLPVG
jgi:hypothetical protein